MHYRSYCIESGSQSGCCILVRPWPKNIELGYQVSMPRQHIATRMLHFVQRNGWYEIGIGSHDFQFFIIEKGKEKRRLEKLNTISILLLLLFVLGFHTLSVTSPDESYSYLRKSQ